MVSDLDSGLRNDPCPRGGYVFLAWVGDHSPRHVHVYRDGRLILKWDLTNRKPMAGSVSRKVLELIQQLDEEGAI